MEPIFITPDDSNYFFGYYDKSPLDFTNQKLLSQRVSFMNRMPTKDDVLEIGYFDWRNNNEFVKLTETKAWNWQQGCMLQWVGPYFKSLIIYNDRLEGKFVSIIMNIETKEKIVLPMAIYSMHPTGKYSVCIDNERHYWFREGYSYHGIENLDKKKRLNENDGIWLLDIKRKNLKQIINIMDLIKIKPLSSMQGGAHYLEHLMFSPSGKRFCFLHRWQINDGGIYTRFFSADMDGGNIYLLNDSGRMSHFCWRNENELLGWCGLPTTINRLRKYKNMVKYFVKPLFPLYHKVINKRPLVRKLVTGDSYVLFKDETDKKTKVYSAVLVMDGHPTFCPFNKDWFVSDTYQNDKGYRNLFLFNMFNGEKIDVTQLKSNSYLDDSPFRCDLHPKWSYDGRYISIDSVHGGNRQMYVYDVEKIIAGL
jgi:hypothetical protein